MSYNDLLDFAKNQNLYDDDDDNGDYVICVKKPKKKKYIRTEQDDKNNNLLCMILFIIYSSFNILWIYTKKISTMKGEIIYELWSIQFWCIRPIQKGKFL